MNGSGERLNAPNAVPAKPIIQARNYKLLVDPLITGKKEPKVYRYDGVMINDTATTVVVRDPRVSLVSLFKRTEIADLPVPRFVNKLFFCSLLINISALIIDSPSIRITLESRRPLN